MLKLHRERVKFEEITSEYDRQLSEWEAEVQRRYDRSLASEQTTGETVEEEILVVRKLNSSFLARLREYLQSGTDTSYYRAEALSALSEGTRKGSTVRVLIPESVYAWLRTNRQGLSEWLQGAYGPEISRFLN